MGVLTNEGVGGEQCDTAGAEELVGHRVPEEAGVLVVVVDTPWLVAVVVVEVVAAVVEAVLHACSYRAYFHPGLES